ncbi:sigma-54 interaction domain-containing protein [Sporolactobacillus terrae]|uniref:Sigma-54-dependent Fis family transcriptional regulator n=1 Tax=Sporolactobacillus terrae TaxID=269673 RepID=A0ABX5Q4A5_9BACL|nr:sigma 54-interacting transcriptional regulator [Sporolactobacillus terrae]QAA21468.1 sigma-54-dependent Fis family transcriptional regulator [Sporolactobacillus terrae]QAA24440.1 sigma-54-dependent Fis family transcriptional regulator [Sporolactobacillus terrae]UAK16267.1 sigma 54-interacting transcriptional regulator [Sporolactobacillus terrae]
MKHLLPELKDLLHTSFVMLSEAQWKTYALEHAFDLIFVQKSLQLIACSPQCHAFANKYRIPLEALPARSAGLVQLDDSWDTIGKKANQYDYLLVVKAKKPIGYIKTGELIPIILEAYTYLKAYNDTILETTDSTISVIDEQMKTVVWTSGAERLYSIKKEEILGKPMTDFFSESRLDNLRIIHSGKRFYHKQHQPREDLFVLINSNPVRVHDRIIGAVSCESDVTHQVHLNQQLNSANEMIQQLQKKVSRLKPSADPFYPIQGSSPSIRRTIDRVKQIGTTQARVLFLGESGVGKELFAKALHDLRTSNQAPFIAINCGAIPPSLFESELFGYEKGAFSGASALGKKGTLELARGGTLFLDEIGELPLDMQVKLLRVLQEGTFYAVGGTRLKYADCFIIAATNKDLRERVKQGKFREDLYYRLNIVSILIPPLRDRIEDVVELSHQILYEFAKKYNRDVKEIPKEIMLALVNHRWPGNIRELRNVIENLVVFSKDGKLNFTDLPVNLQAGEHEERTVGHRTFPSQEMQTFSSLNDTLKACEAKTIQQVLEQTHENKNKTAQILGISRATLYNKMHKLGISP